MKMETRRLRRASRLLTRSYHWKGRPDEYQKEMANKYKQKAPIRYQQQPLETPVQAEPKANIEVIVVRFVESSEKQRQSKLEDIW